MSSKKEGEEEEKDGKEATATVQSATECLCSSPYLLYSWDLSLVNEDAVGFTQILPAH